MGSPVGECFVEVDMSLIGSTQVVSIDDAFSLGAKIVSCQVVAVGLTGSFNGTVDLAQSNDGLNWDTLGIQNSLTAANQSGTLATATFSGKYLGVKITKGAILAGLVRLYFVAKHS